MRTPGTDEYAVTQAWLERLRSLVSSIREFRKKAEKMLEQVGFNHNEFYYPVPDYKMPTAIYSDRYLPKISDLRGTEYAIDRDRFLFFSEALAFDAVCEDNEFPIFSNSFLVFSSKED